MENEKEYNPDILTLSDDDGNDYTFEVLDTIDNDMGTYLALLPVYDDPQEQLDADGELVVVKVMEEDGEEYFTDIEDDAEYETVSEAFIERLRDYFEINEVE